MVQSMALVNLRHFVVEADWDDVDGLSPRFSFAGLKTLDVDLAAMLDANATAQRDVERDLRYRVLQYELQIILSYLSHDGPSAWLKLDGENFPATAGHIKRFISESVGLGMLTAAVQEFFQWEVGPEAIANFDVLPGKMKDEFGTGGVRPDLLFDFKDGERVLAGEARGRSSLGPHDAATRKDQRRRLMELLAWSRDHSDYPVAMTWAYMGGHHVQVDLFTMKEGSIGSLGYLEADELPAHVGSQVRGQFTADAADRSEQRAARLFETAPSARESRRLFGREVKGDWVTADLVRPSDIRMFLGVVEAPLPSSEVRSARSRSRRKAQSRAARYETALGDRMLIVVARSDNPQPEWSRVEALIEGGESDG